MGLFSISLTCYPRLLFENKTEIALKRVSSFLTSLTIYSDPNILYFELKCFPTFLVYFCSPIFLKTSVPKADLRARFCFYVTTCTNKRFGNNNVIIHFYYNLGPNYGVFFFSKLGILKNHVHTNLQAWIRRFKSKSVQRSPGITYIVKTWKRCLIIYISKELC